MIKKRVKQLLALFAVASFIFTFCMSATAFSFDSMYREIVSSSVAYPSNRFLQIKSEENGQPPPYSYINSPKEPYLPYAALLYDGSASLKPPETVPPQNDETDEPELPEGVYPVIPLDMSEGQTENSLFYRNESKYSPDINALADSEYPLKYAQNASSPQDSAPIVLIIHTHGTECYLPDGQETYTADTPTRSTDRSINVVAVGEALAAALTENGIPTVHCKTMFDEKSYSESYDLSERAVLDYIKQYPSIQYVFDVHTIQGKRAGHTDWEMNLVENDALRPFQKAFFEEGSWALRYDYKHRTGICTEGEYLESLEYRKTHEANPAKTILGLTY